MSSPCWVSVRSDQRHHTGSWSRGAQELYEIARSRVGDAVELALYDGEHVFTRPMRDRAYRFLQERLVGAVSA